VFTYFAASFGHAAAATSGAVAVLTDLDHCVAWHCNDYGTKFNLGTFPNMDGSYGLHVHVLLTLQLRKTHF
jgi:hypothetical protein